jgi:selenide,water dikinase
VDSRKLPFFDSALKFAREGLIPAGSYRNRDYVKDRVLFVVEDFMELAVVTPETSGGLVFAFSPEDAGEYIREMEKVGESAWIIGKVTEAADSKLIVF